MHQKLEAQRVMKAWKGSGILELCSWAVVAFTEERVVLISASENAGMRRDA